MATNTESHGDVFDLEEEAEDEEQDLSWQRAYLGYHDRFVADYYFPLHSGKNLRIAQSPATLSLVKMERERDPGITGTTVWDAGVVLAQYLSHPSVAAQFSAIPVNHVLELGSGTGLVSLALAATWRIRFLTMTDISGVLPLLTRNVSLNRSVTRPSTTINVKQLRWAECADIKQISFLPCDVVVGSDLVYSDSIEQSQLLIKTFHQICSAQTIVFLAMHKLHHPERVKLCLSELRATFSNVRVVPTTEQPQAWKTKEVVLVQATGIISQPVPS